MPRPREGEDGADAVQDGEGGDGDGDGDDDVPEERRTLPFFPFTVLLVTGTAGAGKTSSIQALAANLDCVITGTTGIAAQNLTNVLNRTKSAQVKTIYRAFGFNSKHVSMADTASQSRRSFRCPGDAPPVRRQQLRDLATYWQVIEDIATNQLEAHDRKTKRRRGGRLTCARECSELCESNIIVIDECGLLLRHMLHVVVFFYYFHNALHDTALYRERRVPCLVCVGSPTQTEALETLCDPHTQTKCVRRGTDVLSALISDPELAEYCDVSNRWVMFINNKRCLNAEFGDLLKHMEFGLPLRDEHVDYVDRFVRPPSLIRDPSCALGVTRLFISHAEVQRYFRTLHDQLRARDSERLFELPVYCVVNNKSFYEYCALSQAAGGLSPAAWFKSNLFRIINYSQFVDHNMSDDVEVELLGDEEAPEETLIVSRITYIRDSSIGVTSKTKACVVGFRGTFDAFADILRQDSFVQCTPCEQAVYAYSLMSGLLFSGMYLFYTSPYTTLDALREFAEMEMPDVPSLSLRNYDRASEAAYGAMFDAADDDDDDGNGGGGGCGDDATDYGSLLDAGDVVEGEVYEMPSAADAVSDAEMMDSSDLYSDRFFHRYAKPPAVSCSSFEEIVHIYTVFRNVFMARFEIMQRRTDGRFGLSEMVTYNRRNVSKRRSSEIVSHTGSFAGMLSHLLPSSSYTLEGFTGDEVLPVLNDRGRMPPRVTERGLPRLVVRDSLGFISIAELNISKFIDSAHGKSLHICTTADYGINSRAAMTIAKSQGLSLDKVAIDFGDDPRNLKMSQIYVAMSRVVDPDSLMMNLNPMRVTYEKNTYITPYICKALKNPGTELVF